MKSLIRDKLSEIAAKFQNDGQVASSSSLLDECLKTGLEVSLETVKLICSRFSSLPEFIFLQEQIAEFVGKILCERAPSDMLDPWVGTGSLAITVQELIKPSNFDVFSPVPFHAELWKCLNVSDCFNFHKGESIELLDGSEATYDAIVCCPPFGFQRDPMSVVINNNWHEIKGEYAYQLLVKACLHLNFEGIALFVVSNNFFRSQGLRIKALLRDYGFQVTAAIELPSRSFEPSMVIGSHIIVVERVTEDLKLFAGRFSPDTRNQALLLKNYTKRTNDKVAELGRVVEERTFRGFSGIELTERLVHAANQQGLVPIPLKEIAEISLCSTSQVVPEKEDHANSVYLPRVRGTLPVVSNATDLSGKPDKYFQVALNPERANARFLARLLNTSFGHLWRDTIGGGNSLQIDLRDLQQSEIYLPSSLEAQARVEECDIYLSRLKTEITELETRLWKHPGAAKSVLLQARRINQEDRFEDWLETLPFPLASILWNCHTHGGSQKEQYERKLQLLEAWAQFNGVVLLSAFSADTELWPRLRGKMESAFEKGELSLNLATFGTWKVIAEYLSKEGRKMLINHESRERLFEIFKTRNRDVLESLFSKKLISIINEANPIRNNKHGHTGIVSEKEASTINGKLDQMLHDMRDAVGLVWDEYHLISPGENRYRNGIFKYKVRKIMGSRTPFQPQTIEVSEQMEDGHLYLQDPNERRGLKLLPLIKMMSPPKTEENACYFYNRSQVDGIRFVSYHFEPESELFEKFSDVATALRALETIDS